MTFFTLVGIFVVTIAGAIAILFFGLPAPLRRNLKLFLRSGICVIRQRHVELRVIGTIGKTGFRGLPVRQCTYCTMIVVQEADAERFGGKRVS